MDLVSLCLNLACFCWLRVIEENQRSLGFMIDQEIALWCWR